MGVAITKTSKEMRSYYGPFVALLRLLLPPPLPYFRCSGHRRPQLYADAYNSALIALCCSPPALYTYLTCSPLPLPHPPPLSIPVPSLPSFEPDSPREATWS